MTRIRRPGLAPLLLLAIAAGPAHAGVPEPEVARLKAEVATLASRAYAGRSGDGGRKTAEHLVEKFRELGLEPLFDGRYTQDVPDTKPGQVLGRNVGARLAGSDPALRDQWVVLAAHFDHLGVRNGVVYPGADDNASGVAMMLEVARAMAGADQKPKRGVMFVGFDLEEIGLYGSRYFVEHPPVPLKQIALFITADMIGRSLGGICEPYVFVMGSEHAPALRPWIEDAGRRQPVTLGILGTDLLIVDRSDYGPFRAREVPYLFFSTGENPTYHTPSDRPDTLNYAKLEAISRVIHGVVARAVAAPEVPKWSAAPDHPISEARTVRDVLRLVLDHRESLNLGGTQLYMLTNTVRRLDAIVARGSMTPGERVGMVNMARLVMMAIL